MIRADYTAETICQRGDENSEMASRLPLDVFGVDFAVHASGGSRFVRSTARKKQVLCPGGLQVEPAPAQFARDDHRLEKFL